MSKTPPLLKLKTAKHLAPPMFVNKTPRVHLDLLTFLSEPDKYKIICMFRGGGKTTTVNKTNMFSTLFYDKEPYTQIFSVTEEKAIKFLADVKQMIISAMKKKYDIQKGRFWTEKKIEIIVDKKKDGIGKVCYLEVFGAGQDPRGGTSNFARPSLQVFDDIESKQGQYAIGNPRNREKLSDWFWGECIPSLDPIYGKVIFVGTILHEESLLNTLLKVEKYSKKIIPLVTQDGKSAWADRHPLTKVEARAKEKEIFDTIGKKVEIESIEDIRDRLKKDGKIKLFYQEYLCVAQGEETRLFKQQFFKYYKRLNYHEKVETIHIKELTDTKTVHYQRPKEIVLSDGKTIPIEHTYCFATMDIASKKGKDKSVIITVYYDSRGNMYIAPIQAGNWTPSEKAMHTISSYKQYTQLRFGIEKASMQNDFFDTIDESQKANNIKIPVEPLSHNGVSKNIRIANLEPLFIAGKVYFCEDDILSSQLESQFLAFDLEVEGSNDDYIDTLAYQLQFIRNRTFEVEEYEDDEDTAW